MTRIVFISSEEQRYHDNKVPYCTSISTIRVYIVRDDKKFSLLQGSVDSRKLEEVAKEFELIEEESIIQSISHIWGSVEET